MANQKKKKPEHRHGTLTVQDRFFIENNGQMSVEELANTLNQPVSVIQSYCDDWLSKNPQKANRPALTLLDRPSKGAVAMTQAASSAADDGRNKYVTVAAINKALVDGDVELARRLKERFEKQEKDRKDIIRNKYGDMIHYISPLEDID